MSLSYVWFISTHMHAFTQHRTDTVGKECLHSLAERMKNQHLEHFCAQLCFPQSTQQSGCGELGKLGRLGVQSPPALQV